MSETRQRRLTRKVVFWLLLYPLALIMGCLFICLRMLGSVQVRHRERIPKHGGVVVVSNHPSLWEPILLPFLLFPRFILFPDRRMPFCVVDQHNYIDNWLWGVLRMRFVAVPRQDRRGMIRSLNQMTRMVAEGYTLILFPEGGRTFKGTAFVYSATGHRIRELKHGIADIVLRTRATVVPVWVHGAEEVLPNNSSHMPRLWRRTTIVVGHPVTFQTTGDDKIDRGAIIDEITHALLALADEPIS